MKQPKLYVMGQRTAWPQPKQKRAKDGKYARAASFTTYLIIGLFISVLGASTYQSLDNHMVSFTAAPVAMADTIKLSPDKIEAAKDKLVDDISACETKGVKESDATIILDTNHEMSIGSMQFQIRTIQHYISKFDGKDISRVEAIQLAIDHQEAHDLAKKILFTEKGSYENWHTCAIRTDAAAKIDVINSL